MTLPPLSVGGVAAKARILADELVRAGHDVTLAYYRLPAPRKAVRGVFGDLPQREIECRGTFFEQNYTAPSSAWQDIIDKHDRHIAVGGTVLIANPLTRAAIRHMVWCASDLEGDRSDRQSAMAWYRRLYDKLMVVPGLARQQSSVLHADNRIYGVSNDTVDRLTRRAPEHASKFGRLLIPVDTDFFQPATRPEGPFRMGFAGRLDDPRKNAPLLFQALAKVRGRGIDAKLSVTGNLTPTLKALIDQHGVSSSIEFCGFLDRSELRRFYQMLDVFVLTSHQEGFAIAGIEAMACGIPVVSTDCGGPADYVVTGRTGHLTGFSSDEIADAIAAIAADRDLSEKLRHNARHAAETEYSPREFARRLRQAWQETWDEDLA